jgi:putative addiction module killer protein
MVDVQYYLTTAGKCPVDEWLDSLRDKRAVARIITQIDRLKTGNFGDHKYLQAGVWELRIDVGPGYRVYYAMRGGTCVLLLCGGVKRRQAADIQRAIACWGDYQKRTTMP